MRKRRAFSAEFKARIVPDVLSGARSAAETAVLLDLNGTYRKCGTHRGLHFSRIPRSIATRTSKFRLRLAKAEAQFMHIFQSATVNDRSNEESGSGPKRLTLGL